MAELTDRLYELSLHALAEQERQVAELRTRGATLVAAGAVVPSLLAPAAFDKSHPHGVAELTCIGIGIAATAVLLASVVSLLRPYLLGFSVSPTQTHQSALAS